MICVYVYNDDMTLGSVLTDVTQVSYTLKRNDISGVDIRIPADSPQLLRLPVRGYVRVDDGVRDIGVYRYISAPMAAMSGMGEEVELTCEHVIATLIDEVIPGFVTLGGTGMDTSDVIEALLDRQQTVRWVLDECDYADEFEYTFENTDVLTALFSIGNSIVSRYNWVFDTSVFPWHLSLKQASADPVCWVTYGRNLRGIHRSMDDTSRITRIYPRGSGEGINQVTIKSVNDGIEYLDATPIGAAPVSRMYVDTSIEDPTVLKNHAQKILNAYSVPYYAYEIDALDMSVHTGQRYDMCMPGDCVQVNDIPSGLMLITYVETVEKRDVFGEPNDITITIANVERDASKQIAELSSRVAVTELYSQGATNLYSQQYADNASATEPGYMRFYIPSDCVRINKVLLSWELKPFRTYSTGNAAAGAISVSTTLGGETTLSGGGVTSDVSGRTWTDGQFDGGSGSGRTDTKAAMTASIGRMQTGPWVEDQHTHVINAHSASVPSHYHTMPSHVHQMNHTPVIPDHMHTLEGHTHVVEASAHTHSIHFGIYTGTTATKATLIIDGVQAFVDETRGAEVDVTQYLEMDDGGKIRRGRWHEIQIVPDRLTRIEANLFVQLFIQSRGGGDY